jgi:hypothetical protein
MKYTNAKNFYTRTLLLPILAVTAFVLYCANHSGVNAQSMAEAIDQTMANAFYVKPVNTKIDDKTDVLAFIPETKPANVFEVASK